MDEKKQIGDDHGTYISTHHNVRLPKAIILHLITGLKYERFILDAYHKKRRSYCDVSRGMQ